MQLNSEQSQTEDGQVDGNNMERRICSIGALAVCCSALWAIASSSRVKPLPPPPGCDSQLAFSSDVSPSFEGNGDIHSKSLSPWRWRSSTVKNQIPSTIWEAECTSTFCSGLNPGHKDASDLNSVPIHQNILVLERQHNSRCYTASYRSVVVGCTCVRAATNHT